MALRGLSKLLAMVTLFWAAAGAGGDSAEAATIYTFTFNQQFTTDTGGLPSAPADLSGGFTGTADALGYINLGTITDFHLEISAFLVSAQYSGLPDYFSFLIGDASGSTLAFQSAATLTSLPDTAARVCVGAAVAALCNGGTWRGVYQLIGASSNLATSGIAPVVTLVSATGTPPVATTPIPGGWLLFSTALVSAGLAHVLRRRAQPSSAL